MDANFLIERRGRTNLPIPEPLPALESIKVSAVELFQMKTNLLDQIRQSLTEKRDNLVSWLMTSSSLEQKIRLGERPADTVQEHLHQLDEAIARASDKTLGVCEVCRDYIEEDLLQMDYMCRVCLTHLSPEEARHLEADLQLAMDVQQSLLPQDLPDVPGLDVAAYSRPAQIIGGDYFDFFRFADGGYGFAIGDVAGHGMAASLHMASVQTLLGSIVPSAASPGEVLRRVQHLYQHNVRFTTFVTLVLGSYDPATGEFTYCNAGHNPPFVVRASGDAQEPLRWLEPGGPAIGLIEGFEFQQGVIRLEAGDVLILYTDGITEAVNIMEEMFGQERLVQAAAEAMGGSAADIVRGVRERLAEFTGGRPLADDLTLVVLKKR